MSTAALTEIETMADLLRQLGVDATRIRMRPLPGLATEKDVIEIHDRTNRLCELIDGVLVEKVMGFYEGRLAMVLGYFFETFLNQHDLGNCWQGRTDSYAWGGDWCVFPMSHSRVGSACQTDRCRANRFPIWCPTSPSKC